jgi:hypothetical protein
MEQEKFNPIRVRIEASTDKDILRAATTKIYDIDTGKQLMVSSFNIYIEDGILMVDLKSYFAGLDIVCTIGSHIVRCVYCKNIQERIVTKELPEYACINYLDTLHDGTAIAGQLNCQYCERNSQRIFEQLRKDIPIPKGAAIPKKDV